jgi:hypothetical protein
VARNALLGRDIAKALEEAGVVTDLDSVIRIVIDIDGTSLPAVYVQRVGDDRLLGIVPMLTDPAVRVIDRPRPVRYWVQVADDLMGDSAPDGWPPSLRPVRPDDSAPPPDAYSRWWLFEDTDAPAELDGKKVELTFIRVDHGLPQITGRRVIT